MRIFNAVKTQELLEYDLETGYLKPDILVTGSTQCVPEVQEVGHFEVVSEFSNGGKEVQWVVDVPYSPAIESTEITEEIQIYIPYTAEELLWKKRKQIISWLTENNYKSIHHINGIQGWLSGDEKYENYRQRYQTYKTQLDGINQQIEEITGADPDSSK